MQCLPKTLTSDVTNFYCSITNHVSACLQSGIMWNCTKLVKILFIYFFTFLFTCTLIYWYVLSFLYNIQFIEISSSYVAWHKSQFVSECCLSLHQAHHHHHHHHHSDSCWSTVNINMRAFSTQKLWIMHSKRKYNNRCMLKTNMNMSR